MATVINTDSLKVRKTGATYGQQIGSLSRGTIVAVWEDNGKDWFKVDSNKNGTAFCSNSALVFSTWTKDGENWVFANGVKGEGGTYSTTPVVYSYTSTKDNELVRLCYRSEEKAGSPIDPALRPVVTLKTPVADAPVVPETGDGIFSIIAVVLATMSIAVVAAKKREF